MRPLTTRSRWQRGLVCLPLLLAPAAHASENAAQHIVFSYDFDSKCVVRNGKMLQIKSNHAQRKIKVYLQRYFADKRQPGRTVQVLEPGDEAVGLGCTMIDGKPQAWKLIKAKYLD